MASKTTYCSIYLARHGESEWNAIDKIQGQQDTDLTLQGEKQALNLANKLKHINFAAIFSSDLMRAKRTAEIIKLDRQLAIITAQALRERTFGQAEGKTGHEFESTFKDLIQKREKLSYQNRYKFKLAPDIESDEELMIRFLTYLREIAVAYIDKTILVVCHSGPLRTLLIHLGFATYKQMPPAGGTVSNTAYVKLLSDGVDFFVKDTFGITKLNQ